MTAARESAAVLLRAHAQAALDSAAIDLREAARDVEQASDKERSASDRAMAARMAITGLGHALRRLSQAEAFEQAAKLAAEDEP